MRFFSRISVGLWRLRAWQFIPITLLCGILCHVCNAQDVGSKPDVKVQIDPRRDVHPISPLIYGINGLYEQKETPNRKPVCTVVRLGGNRTTAYNWVTNDSNAGADWHHQNDSHMGKGHEPGEAARTILDYTMAHRMCSVITIPTIGYVAGDRNGGGDVLKSGPDYLEKRFKVSRPAKNAPFSLKPDPAQAIDDVSPEVVNARLQAPRSFWDPTYVEKSWYVGANHGKPLCIFPELKNRIAQFYPGTKIAITEYNFGARGHISGGLAQADFLGIMGREGIEVATWWSLGSGGTFVLGAFDLYRNFDGKGGAFGDTSVFASTDNIEATSVYASLDTRHPDVLTIVVINKTSEPRTMKVAVAGSATYKKAEVFRLTAESPVPVTATPIPVESGGRLSCVMPGHSATLLRLRTD